MAKVGLEASIVNRARSYPGEGATADEVFFLAEEYRNAAGVLLGSRRPREPLSRAPYRQVAIHAIELYLNALLLADGLDQARIRSLQHDLAARAEHALASGLALRSRTAAHLIAMAESREYLVSRYGTDQASTLSQINRLQATLEEIGLKVGRRLGLKPAASNTQQSAQSPQVVSGSAT